MIFPNTQIFYFGVVRTHHFLWPPVAKLVCAFSILLPFPLRKLSYVRILWNFLGGLRVDRLWLTYFVIQTKKITKPHINIHTIVCKIMFSTRKEVNSSNTTYTQPFVVLVQQYPLVDDFLNSHHLFDWQCIDIHIVRGNGMLITFNLGIKGLCNETDCSID